MRKRSGGRRFYNPRIISPAQRDDIKRYLNWVHILYERSLAEKREWADCYRSEIILVEEALRIGEFHE